MARVLEEFEFPAWKPPRQGSRYPIETWLNGQTWLIQNGEDFTCNPKTIRQMLSTRARKFGLRAKTMIQVDGSVVIKAVPREEKEKVKGKK